jgi:hypothetical protein
MTDNNATIYFKLAQWYALSNRLSTENDWRLWAENSNHRSEQPLTKQHIPPMVRRRMSALSQLAVQTALQLLEQHPDINYLVFASRHGELPRTVQLLQSILNKEDPSPTAFSQSVHNTASGLTTIIAQKPVPVTSIAARENSFHQAMVEAYAYLEDAPNHKVLVIDFDDQLPETYQQYISEDFEAYAVGLVLSSGQELSLSWPASQARLTGEIPPTSWPQSVLWLQCLLTEQPEWTISSDTTQWLWRQDSDKRGTLLD